VSRTTPASPQHFDGEGNLLREYGQVQCAFWQSDLGNLSDDAKLLALYLMTGPHSNGSGCYPCPIEYVMGDLRWPSERVSEGFEELSRYGFSYRFGSVVFIRKYLAWNPVANANVALARMKEFRALPTGDGKALLAMAILKYCKHFSAEFRGELETVAGTVTETVSQTVWQTRSYPTRPNPIPPNPTQTRPGARENPDEAGKGSSREGDDPSDTHRASALVGEDGADAWREIEGIDAEAMQDWIKHRAIVKPPHGLRPHERLFFGKMLAGMGTPERQRAAVQMAISNGWNNLRPQDAETAAGKATATPYRRKTADELEAEERERAAS
jgi:hypothetical protein